MSNFFNVDNGFFTFLGKICDVIFLSVVWVLLCIPIITIGPANTAMYYATVKVIRRERGYLFREFFRSFKMNFKRGAIIGVILTVMYVILFIDIIAAWSSVQSATDLSSIFFGIYIAIALLLVCFTIYVFPVLSRFEISLKQLVKTVFFMSMRHLPSTIGMLIITAAAVVGSIYIPLLIFIVPATSTFLNSFLMERVFKKYMPKTENTGEDNSKDEWYLE
jgi:uncharacterized membrane protein YesL